MNINPGSLRKLSGRHSLIVSLMAVLVISLPFTLPPAHAAGACPLSSNHPSSGNTNTERTTVIVAFKSTLTKHAYAALSKLGIDIYRHLPLIHSLAVDIPSRNLQSLARLPFVRHLSPDETIIKQDEFTVASSEAGTAYQQFQLTGSGLSIAIVDSGVQAVDDLTDPKTGQSRILQSVNFAPDGAGTADVCGHGTLVAGIAAGNGTDSAGSNFSHTFYGIAQQAQIINVRVLNAQGQGIASNVVAGIQWVVQNKAAYNIRVLNLSLGHPVTASYVNDPLCQAVEAAWKAGIVVVCAAGNSGRLNSAQSVNADNEGWGTAYGSIQSPGNDPSVITVGATKSMDGNRADDHIATYSSRGPTRFDFVSKPDIIAPGNRIISLQSGTGSYLSSAFGATNHLPWSSYSTQAGSDASGSYFHFSGTSMAAPVVAGAVALLLQSNPNLTPDVIKARLMFSADRWGFPCANGDVCTFGTGYLDIPAALNSKVTPQYPMLSPTLLRNMQGTVSFNPNNGFWKNYSLWGTGVKDPRSLWGTTAFATGGDVTANSGLWGNGVLTPSSALQGNGVLVTKSGLWGNILWNSPAPTVSSAANADLSSIAVNGE